jgi:hypothetical protein
MVLDWPSETVLAEDKIEQWHQPVSNRVLDFHGDPIKANLVVFSDGNHHMALLHSLKAFHHEMPQKDIRLFISNPETEKTSYTGYRQTLLGMAKRQGLDGDAFCQAVFGKTAVFGQRIHHREAPEAVVAGQADVAIVYYHLALRYTRIFPDKFDTIPLGGTKTAPEPPPENLISKIHMGLINDGGPWGEQFFTFMKSETVARIYAKHGLQHRRDVHLTTKGD